MSVKFLAQGNNDLSLTGFEPMRLAILRLLARRVNYSTNPPRLPKLRRVKWNNFSAIIHLVTRPGELKKNNVRHILFYTFFIFVLYTWLTTCFPHQTTFTPSWVLLFYLIAIQVVYFNRGRVHTFLGRFRFWYFRRRRWGQRLPSNDSSYRRLSVRCISPGWFSSGLRSETKMKNISV